MVLGNAFRQLNSNLTIILVPIILDAAALWAGLSLAGFSGQPKWSLKLLLDMGLPTVSHLSNMLLMANSIDFLKLFASEMSVVALITVFLMLIVYCLVQGGYIASLHVIATTGEMSFKHFFRSSKAFFLRFATYYITVFLAKISITLGLVAIFGVVGLFLSLLVFIVLRILFIFLEFTIVVDRLSWDQVLGQSRAYLKSSLFRSGAVILVMYVSSGMLSLLLHRFWSPAALIVGILSYSYVMSGIQLALMLILCKERMKEV